MKIKLLVFFGKNGIYRKNCIFLRNAYLFSMQSSQLLSKLYALDKNIIF